MFSDNSMQQRERLRARFEKRLREDQEKVVRENLAEEDGRRKQLLAKTFME